MCNQKIQKIEDGGGTRMCVEVRHQLMHVPAKYNDAYSFTIQLNLLKLHIDKGWKEDVLPEVSKGKEWGVDWVS